MMERNWKPLKELRLTYPLELAKYAKANNLIEEPAFAWWAYDTLCTHTRIISKTKSKYLRNTHKYGIELPHSVKESLAIDIKNKNGLWRNTIEKEMKKIRLMDTFKKYNIHLRKYGKIELSCHVIKKSHFTLSLTSSLTVTLHAKHDL